MFVFVPSAPQVNLSPSFEKKTPWLLSIYSIYIYMGTLTWWYPTTFGFPTKNDNFGGTTTLGNTPV